MRRVLRAIMVVVWVSSCVVATTTATASSPPAPAGTIAFSSDRLNVGSTGVGLPICRTGNCADIFTIQPDGTGLTRLTPASMTGFEGCPSWSPDGSQIAFFRTLKGFRGQPSHQIYVMDADGTDITQLTSGNHLSVCPSWSPDGALIAFVRRPREGPSIPYGRIAVMEPDGTNVTEITHGTDYDFRPVWSPDGSQIAFERDFACFCRSAIYVMGRDGSGLTELVDGMDPAWAPDDEHLSFWDPAAQALEVYALSTGTVSTLATAARLGGDPTFDRMSSWSPDGRWIATGACCDVSGGVPLMLVSSEGSVVRAVPNGGSAMAPAWR